MPKGTVDFFNDTGGYGFIESDAVDEDVFFHLVDFDVADVTEGDRVEFTIEHAEKGPRARTLRPIDSADDGSTAGTDATADADASSSIDVSSSVDGSSSVDVSIDVSGGASVANGRIDFFNDTGGYGFVEATGYDEDVFFHMEDVDADQVSEGDEVIVAIVEAEKGPRAEELALTGGEGGVDISGGAAGDVDLGGDAGGTAASDAGGGESGDTEVFDAGGSGPDETEVFDAGGSGPDETEAFDAGGSRRGGESRETPAPDYCTKCGASLAGYDDPEFCPGCGSSI